MPRTGYGLLTLDDETVETLDNIATKEGCKTRPEVLRLLIREWKNRPNRLNPSLPNALEFGETDEMLSPQIKRRQAKVLSPGNAITRILTGYLSFEPQKTPVQT